MSVTDSSGREGGVIRFTVELSGQFPQPVSQPVKVEYATSSGTAASGTDFLATSGTLVFWHGGERTHDHSQIVRVPTIHDTVQEVDETFTLTLSSSTHPTLGSVTGTGRITNNNDPVAAQTPRVNTVDKNVAEGDEIVFEVFLSASSDRSVTVRYATESGADRVHSNANARSGKDFTAVSGTLSFAPGEARKTVRVSTTSDSAYEWNEKFYLRLSNPTNARLNSSRGYLRATGTIVVDDPPPTVSISNGSATEGDEVEFKISLSAPTGRTVYLDVQPEVGPGDTATLHGDFNGSRVTLAGGGGTDQEPPSFTVRVITVDDDIDEKDETFTVRLLNPRYATLGDATATGTITEADTDVDGSPFVAVKASTDAVEGKPVTFAVRLSAPTEQTVTVQYQARGINCFSGHNCGSAISGVGTGHPALR